MENNIQFFLEETNCNNGDNNEIIHNHVVGIGTKRNYFSLLSKIFNYYRNGWS